MPSLKDLDFDCKDDDNVRTCEVFKGKQKVGKMITDLTKDNPVPKIEGTQLMEIMEKEVNR